MTSTLHDQLSRLADEAGTAAPGAPAHDLWERGRRWQRRRRAGTTVIAGVAAALVIAVGGLSWQKSAPTPIAPAGAPVGIPSEIHAPSKWLPGTDGHPLGQLVAVVGADRGGWFGSAYGSVGVAATTGEYRFLDLPRQASDLDVALAPDGRHVAYWVTGATTDTPNTSEGYARVITGVGVYDTTTGEHVEHQIPTAHGLGAMLLAWVDADSLLIDYTQDAGGDDDSDMDQSSGAHAAALRWELGSEPVDYPMVDEESVDTVGPSTGGRAIAWGYESGFWLFDDDGDARSVGGGSLDPEAAVNPAGTAWASLDTSTRQPAGLAVYDRGGVRPVGTSDKVWGVAGWADDDHVLVYRRIKAEDPALNSFGLFSVDVQSGRQARLVEMQDSYVGRVEWATDLLGSPVVDRPAPPTPLGPRWTASLVVLAVAGGLLGVWGWRRRVQP